MAISNIVYLNRVETARSKKQLRNRPRRIAVDLREELDVKEFLETIKEKSERQVKLNNF